MADSVASVVTTAFREDSGSVIRRVADGQIQPVALDAPADGPRVDQSREQDDAFDENVDMISVHSAPPPPDAAQVDMIEEAIRAQGLRPDEVICRLLAIVGAGVGVLAAAGQRRHPLLLDHMVIRPPLFEDDISDPLVVERESGSRAPHRLSSRGDRRKGPSDSRHTPPLQMRRLG